VGNRKQLKRLPVREVTTVYRVVGTSELDPVLLEPYFKPEAEPEAVTKREESYPELLDGICADSTIKQAQVTLSNMRKAASRDGESEKWRDGCIAEVTLRPDQGFDYENRKKSHGKQTIWGDSANLAASVCRLHQTDDEMIRES
jgi:hypothetical protein